MCPSIGPRLGLSNWGLARDKETRKVAECSIVVGSCQPVESPQWHQCRPWDSLNSEYELVTKRCCFILQGDYLQAYAKKNRRMCSEPKKKTVGSRLISLRDLT
ncbi:hypothetical protein BO86DRAFT_51455 [Aspergillus japonicus CBS 114.51]|uniref:Uncharacterized protein n=1 Tax=Aspergillus japonicus CBS 114.51 TaxID=1448312 RepID=A0A8T8X5L2_ASPJA|nr:hypothetical protein BO86DRAFT_51455 [Aspergillus japonicus CBS 114.51]RAH83443.1 hypothetical protein BO86DRAFT_51455 [Aspergillus japonicus CBS 114.51]